MTRDFCFIQILTYFEYLNTLPCRDPTCLKLECMARTSMVEQSLEIPSSVIYLDILSKKTGKELCNFLRVSAS